MYFIKEVYQKITLEKHYIIYLIFMNIKKEFIREDYISRIIILILKYYF